MRMLIIGEVMQGQGVYGKLAFPLNCVTNLKLLKKLVNAFLWGGGGWGTRCSTLLSLKLDGTFPHLDFFLYVSPNKKHFISYLMFPFVCVESNL